MGKRYNKDALYIAAWRYMGEEEREAVEKKNRAAFRETLDKICAALGRAEISYQRKDYTKESMAERPWMYDCGHLASVDEFDMSTFLKITVPCEHGRPEYADGWHMKSAIRIQIGSRTTNLVRFVEGKKGFDYDMIVREIMAWVSARREAAENSRRSLVERRKLEEAVEVLNKKYAQKGAFTSAGWTSLHPMAEPGSGGMIKVCLPDMRIDKAEAVLAFARKLGL
jgi:hypothetical protein